MAPPSTTQPPGKRTKPGFRSAIICAIAGRKPLGRSLKVRAGNNETRSNQTLPLDRAEIANREFGLLRVAVLQHPP